MKKNLYKTTVLALALFSGVQIAGAQSLTMSQVAAHNTQSDCYIAVSGNAYSVTSYINQHPGGANTIVRNCGKDATTDFTTKGGNGRHSQGAWAMLANYLVGTVQASTTPTPVPTPSPVPTPTPTPTGTTTPQTVPFKRTFSFNISEGGIAYLRGIVQSVSVGATDVTIAVKSWFGVWAIKATPDVLAKARIASTTLQAGDYVEIKGRLTDDQLNGNSPVLSFSATNVKVLPKLRYTKKEWNMLDTNVKKHTTKQDDGNDD